MTTLLIITFLAGFSAHIVVQNFQEFRHKRRQVLLQKRAEKIKKEAESETIKFINELGGAKFIEQCHRLDKPPMVKHSNNK